MALRMVSTRVLRVVCGGLLATVLIGCNSNAWMGDPTAGGYYKPTPTSIPILDRIDIIEQDVELPQLTKVTSADLTPSDLEYRIAPGDVLDVEIYGLYAQSQRHPVQRRVDQGGYFRVPEVGDVLVAGLTPQGAQEVILKELASKVMTHPSVQVSMLDQTGFTYTVYGGLARWGVFKLSDPDLRLIDVLALAGGVPQSIKKIYVIRQLPVSDTMLPTWDREKENASSRQPQEQNWGGQGTDSQTTTTTPSIEELIQQLDGGVTNPQAPNTEKPSVEISEPNGNTHIDSLIDQLDIGVDTDAGSTPKVSPGVIQTVAQPLVDVDDLISQRNSHQPIDVDELTNASVENGSTTDAAYIYVPESDTWIAVSTDPMKRSEVPAGSGNTEQPKAPTVLERIIEIPWTQLREGDSSYNIVIRPDDRIYIKAPPLGNMYVRGEVARPGVYTYPNTGHKITLTQFIISAGDLGPIAVPEKVSLTRRIGDNVQATITLNYAAILQQTEPDIFIKPNDIISIGTSWGATPMAIIRNGFRATYGFGFLLDRNFGNDVFGRPP
jgi:protein involved in polysaccharide export with SLBB domain